MTKALFLSNVVVDYKWSSLISILDGLIDDQRWPRGYGCQGFSLNLEQRRPYSTYLHLKLTGVIIHD